MNDNGIALPFGDDRLRRSHVRTELLYGQLVHLAVIAGPCQNPLPKRVDPRLPTLVVTARPHHQQIDIAAYIAVAAGSRTEYGYRHLLDRPIRNVPTEQVEERSAQPRELLDR